tara:strand:+ start:4935 stop:5237 length:303 start_codon:yes stop_codon:yes gene_type:complete
MATYGQNIKNARKQHSLTQKRLASQLGITQGLLSLYEGDKQDPPQEVKEVLQKAIGVKPQYTNLKYDDQQQKVISEFVKLIEAIDPNKGVPKIEVKVIYE